MTTGSNGRKKVAYMELVPVLIEAVKEQQATIDDQQKAIADLLDKVEKLETEMRLGNSMAMTGSYR